MANESKALTDVQLQDDIKLTIKQAMQELEERQRVGISLSDLEKKVNSVYDSVKSTATNVGTLVSTFKPKVPQILNVNEITEMVNFSKQAFVPAKMYKIVNDLAGLKSNKLKAGQDAPIAGLLQAMTRLNKNIDTILSRYVPEFFGTMLQEINTGIDNASQIVVVLEPYLGGQLGVKIPDTIGLTRSTKSLNDFNVQLEGIDAKTSDEEISKIWKPIKIGLLCVLSLIKDCLSLLKDIAPLTIRLGAGAGVAAGVNATGKASASVISLGSLSWGTAGTLVGSIMTLIKTGDEYFNYYIAQRS